MGYVGVTKRPLQIRIGAHDHLARLQLTRGGPGTLAAAMRQAFAAGHSFESAFEVEVLAETSSEAEATELERTWIARLGTARPNGFNILPGGASLGGPANATPVSVDHPVRGTLVYESLMDAVPDLNRERVNQGNPPLRLGTIYARLELGWSAEEALELKAHRDRRQRRAAFRCCGRIYDTLDELARAEGMPIDTIRSRLHRAPRRVRPRS
jgi:hypothetical protein